MKPITKKDRILGGIWGVLIGDAIGVPYEFKSSASIPPAKQIGIEYVGPGAPTHGVPAGTWSDDGAQTLALASTCMSTNPFNPEALGLNLVAWKDHGAFAVDQRVFDIGNATSTAIAALKRGVPWTLSGGREDSSNGNGSLMRALPLALWHTGSDAELARDAVAASAVTHAHSLSIAACAVYSVAARNIFRGDLPNRAVWRAFAAAPKSLDGAYRKLELELEKYETPRGSGYVVDSLAFAFKVANEYETYSFARAVQDAVKLGGDTDTTAAIAGGLAGVIYGFDSIPAAWFEGMRGKEIASPIIDKIAEMRSATREAS